MSSIQLHGFNNLTKNLNISLYKVDYLSPDSSTASSCYQQNIKAAFNAQMLSTVLDSITDAIGAQVLTRSEQNYQPHGASVTYMIADSEVPISLVNHLTKSHICAHTYPDTAPQQNTAIFRLDLDISTCGVISPLNVLNHLFKSFSWDVLTIDYKVRGFTRDIIGNKHYQDDAIENITDYIQADYIEAVELSNDNQPHLFSYHSRLMHKKLSEGMSEKFTLSEAIKTNLQKEKNEIYKAYLK